MAEPQVVSRGRPTATTVAKRHRDLRIASFSDVHLGHPQTPTSLIVDNLRTYGFPNTAETGELDLILLGGDLFDEGLLYTDDTVDIIELWMLSFLKLCAGRNIILRVLEGTPSHDRKQSRRFDHLIQTHDLKLDFKYVTEISVETIEALGITMLYVPDFTSPDTDKIWKQVQQVMAQAGLTAVDYANIHGAFTYQMPPIERVQNACHAMERYLGIVENYIFTGHIHLPSVYERIYSNGSFDRLNHGEEEPKGHWRAVIRQNGEDDFVFKVNLGARIYQTVDLTAVELNYMWESIDELGTSLPRGAAVRLIVERGHPILTEMNRLKLCYPHVAWSTKAVDKGTSAKELLQDYRSAFEEITLTPENITDLLMARVRAKTTNPKVAERAARFLGDYR